MPPISTYISRDVAIHIILDGIFHREISNNMPAIWEAACNGGLLVRGGSKLYRTSDGWLLGGYSCDGRDVLLHIDRDSIRDWPLQEVLEANARLRHAAELWRRAWEIDNPTPTHVETVLPAPKPRQFKPGRFGGWKRV